MIIQSILGKVPETIRKIKHFVVFWMGLTVIIIQYQISDGKIEKKLEWFLNDFQERFADSGLKVLFYRRQKLATYIS